MRYVCALTISGQPQPADRPLCGGHGRSLQVRGPQIAQVRATGLRCKRQAHRHRPRVCRACAASTQGDGKLHPALHARIEAQPAREIPVAVWLDSRDAELLDKPARGAARRRPPAEAKALEEGKAVAARFTKVAERHGMKIDRIDSAAPVVFGTVAADRVAELADSPEVAAVFLHQTEGFDDLGNSVGIANADCACLGLYRHRHQRGRATSGALTTPVSWISPINPTAPPPPASIRDIPTASSRTSSATRPMATHPTQPAFRQQLRPGRDPLGSAGWRVHRDQPELPP